MLKKDKYLLALLSVLLLPLLSCESCFLLYSLLGEHEIVVTEPAEGRICSLEDSFEIVWEPKPGKIVAIELYRGDQLVKRIGEAANDGLYTWDSVMESPGTDYKIKIQNLDDELHELFSGESGTFCITPYKWTTLEGAGDEEAGKLTLVMDGEDKPVIAYQSTLPAPGHLCIKRWNGTVWHDLGSPGENGLNHFSLAGLSDRLVVVYTDEQNNETFVKETLSPYTEGQSV